MNLQIVTSLVAALLGAAVGLFLPLGAQKLALYKCKKKNRELVEDSRFTGWLAKVPCALANGIGWGLCWYFGAQVAVPAVLAAVIWSLGVILILVDLRLRLIPNEVLLWMLIVGVIMQVWVRGFGALFGCVFASMIVFCLFATLGNFMGLYKIGAGDVKLAMVITMSLGYPTILTTLLGFSVSLLLFCVIGLLLKKITLKSYLPLGPFLVPGFWVGLIVLLNTAVV
ncbi:MAG: prepilin peptidase [Oscillospiraceae bacterium]|nr:prepilin peptidase [Oscillospiraceae bacterium]